MYEKGMMIGGVAAQQHYAKQTEALKECQVNRELTRVSVAAERARGFTSDLELRLSSVAQPTTEDKCQPTPRPVLVPMADGLYNIADDLERTAARLESLLRRLEL